MAGRLIESDPQTAFAHAEAARRRASRLPIAREASAETAYAAGEYAHALNEYRALRRMTGSTEYLPVMADCERALGRPQQALKIAKEAADQDLTLETKAEMVIVEAGARDDLGQRDEARRLLRAAVMGTRRPAVSAARLRYAFAEMLMADGDQAEARRLLVEAAELDPEGETGAVERLDELDGMIIDFDDFDDFDDPDDPEHSAEPADHDRTGDVDDTTDRNA